jgi:hypothetical protein
MVYKRKPQSKFEQVIITIFTTIILLAAGLVLLRFIVPGTIDNGDNGVKFIEVPGTASPEID